MDIKEIELRIRDAIELRQEEGIAVRNGAVAEILGLKDGFGYYWDEDYPKMALCLIGALKAHYWSEAAMMLGISREQARLLDDGFEGNPIYLIKDHPDRPFWELGRAIGYELEMKARAELQA